MPQKFALALHGGAGTITKKNLTPAKEKKYRAVLQKALRKGRQILEKGNSAVEAVTAAVMVLEDSHLFNAGRGAVFSHSGEQEMEASIMDGLNLQAGAAIRLKLVKNPVLLARAVMEKSPHVCLSGEGALEFAVSHNIALVNKDYFFDELRFKQWLEARQQNTVVLDFDAKITSTGTVGAVALDQQGNLAAATSTGGMTNKRYGRIGDSPIIGAGNYANNKSCAVSCTGQGEYFMRLVAAHTVAAQMSFGRKSLEKAVKFVMQQLKDLGGSGGLIAVDKNSNIAMPFISEGMYRACIKQGESEYIGIYRD